MLEDDSGLGPSAERPTLVLLPGMDGTGALFGPLLDVIGDAVPTLVVSYPVDRVMSYEELTLLVLDQLPATRKYLVVAESFSGPIAIRLAASPPPGLIGVVLSATFASNPTGFPPRIVRAFASLLVRLRPPRLFVRWRLLRRGASKSLTDFVLRTIQRVDHRVFASRLIEVATVDVRSDRAQTQVPILWMHATRDKLLRGWRWSAEGGAPGMERAVFLEGPHLLLQSCSAEAWDEIEAFATSCAATPDRTSGNHV